MAALAMSSSSGMSMVEGEGALLVMDPLSDGMICGEVVVNMWLLAADRLVSDNVVNGVVIMEDKQRK